MGFKARRIKFKVFDRLNKDCHIVGENHHDHMSCGKFEDLEVSYYNYQTGEGSITYDEELPEDGSDISLCNTLVSIQRKTILNCMNMTLSDMVMQ